MKSKLLAAVAAMAVATALPAFAQAPAPTAAEAKAFIEKVEADLTKVSEYDARASWVRATYITEDTMWLEAKASAEANELKTRYAMEAARFNNTAADPVTRRKLDILKRNLVSPAPQRPGAA